MPSNRHCKFYDQPMNTFNKFSPDEAAMKSWRHTIHQHPELGFSEFATSRLVAECLEQWGFEVHGGIATTGVVGTLTWGEGGPRLGLRADMDALPIEELTGLPWASRTPGQMHACGHDGHTAILLGAAQVFGRMHQEGRLPGSGTLNLIFSRPKSWAVVAGRGECSTRGCWSVFPVMQSSRCITTREFQRGISAFVRVLSWLRQIGC